jgi:hypothetical protein
MNVTVTKQEDEKAYYTSWYIRLELNTKYNDCVNGLWKNKSSEREDEGRKKN